MNKDLKISFDFKSISNFFVKYSLTIFIILVTAGLSSAVLVLTSTIERTSRSGSIKANEDINSFDQATIDRVNQLSSSDATKNEYEVPSGRINPFAE